jgi:bacillopeptidase F
VIGRSGEFFKIRRKFLLLVVPFLIFLTPLLSQAAVVSPKLQSLLNTLPDQAEISVIVTLSEKADIHLIKDMDKRLRRSKIITTLKSKADITQRPLRDFLEIRKARKIKSLWLINGMAITASASVIRDLAGFPEVEKIRADEKIQAPKPIYELAAAPEWNLAAIGAPELWALGYTGQGVVVANMDTGVDIDHPDLQTRWRGGMNSWYDPNGEHDTPHDADGHGTATMGVMVGGDAGGTAIGVAPGAMWIAVKIFNDLGQAPLSAVHQGFQWLLDPDGDPGTDDAPDVVNNSWGDDNVNGCSLEFEPDIQALKAAGIAVVFAGGNSGPNPSTSISPANNPDGFAVGAVGQSLAIPTFSSRGPSACDGRIYPELAAPGVIIRTTDLSFGGSPFYTFVSGTSIATPHVAGAIALLRNAFPELTVPEMELALKQAAFDLGSLGPDNDSGYGFLDVKMAYDLLLNPVPNISAFPLSHQFSATKEGSLSSPIIFTIDNKGLQPLVIGSVSMTGQHSSEFIVQTDSCTNQTLLPTQNCSVQVALSPTSGGAKNANLSIPSNDPDANPLNVALSGTGIEQYLLSVATAGSGAGKVTSTKAEIDCGSDCQELLNPRTWMTLKATPDPDSAVGNWSGCAYSFGTTCRVSMDSDKNVTATFAGPSLTVTSPNGGEEWKLGAFKKITWAYTGNPGAYVRIELLKNDILHSTIASTVGKGSIEKGTRYWRIPKDLPAGGDYKIQITSTTNSAHTDTSDNNFTVTP